MKPRFSLANMLLAITLICVCIAWYLGRTQLNKRYEANRATLVLLKEVQGNDFTSTRTFLKDLASHETKNPVVKLQHTIDVFDKFLGEELKHLQEVEIK